MSEEKKVEHSALSSDNEGLDAMENNTHDIASAAPEVMVNRGEALDPEEVKAFWDRYSSRIKGRLKKIERRQSESVRWARETLIR